MLQVCCIRSSAEIVFATGQTAGGRFRCGKGISERKGKPVGLEATTTKVLSMSATKMSRAERGTTALVYIHKTPKFVCVFVTLFQKQLSSLYVAWKLGGYRVIGF